MAKFVFAEYELIDGGTNKQTFPKRDIGAANRFGLEIGASMFRFYDWDDVAKTRTNYSQTYSVQGIN